MLGTQSRLLRAPASRPKLVDTTMLYAPRSGGVKRYLTAKRAWFAAERPNVRHTLVVPGDRHAHDGAGQLSIYAAPLPFGDGYRWPASKTAWMKRLLRQRPTIIEAGDPYTPGLAAQKAGELLGVPVVGFCHTDLGALAALHIGEWAEKPVRRHWGEVYRRFDRAVAPSRFIAERLADAGVPDPVALPLGVDIHTFNPSLANREGLRRKLGLSPEHRLLVFAGRPAREKRVDVLVEAVERLGEPYVLLLIGAAAAAPASSRVIELPYQSDPRDLAALMASCDAFVHANDAEPFGLIVLEAMASGLPVVGVASGGVAESVDASVGELARRSTPEDFAEAVAGLFDRDVRAVGQAARRRVVEAHGWRSVFERLARLYGELSDCDAFLEGPQVH
ncbi:MAG TPA: glycosyltransferase [Caulobacteraceae bacterium]|nr:glycosyltransferase [Caulobacteraceae bacterium]